MTIGGESSDLGELPDLPYRYSGINNGNNGICQQTNRVHSKGTSLARSSKSHIRNYNPLPWIYRCLSSSGMIYLKTIISIGFFLFF